MHLTDAIDKFLGQLAADGRAGHTQRQYTRHLALFATWATERGLDADLARIDHEAVAAFLASPVATTRAQGGAKRATSANCLRSSVRGFLRHCHRAGYVAQDPGRLIRRAVCGTPPPRALSGDEQARLLAYLDAATGPDAARDRVLVRFLLGTGVRLSSALAIGIEDLDLERAEVTLRATKGNRPSRVILGTAVAAELADFVGTRTTGPLFVAAHGGPVSLRHAQRRIGEALAAAGVRGASAHSLRHTFATGLYQQTGDVLLVRDALHHRSIASTLVYARGSEDRLRRALG